MLEWPAVLTQAAAILLCVALFGWCMTVFIRQSERRSMMETTIDPKPEPMQLHCPVCKVRHIDEVDPETGIDWSKRPHKTHLCRGCGNKWKPFERHTIGV